MRTIVYTINKFLFAGILILILGTNLQAQEIDATLSGNTSGEGFSIKNLSGTTLFRFRGDGRFGIGTMTPTGSLDVESSSNSQTEVMINNTGSGDPTVRFQLAGSSKFTIGVDNSDGDKFKIGFSSSVHVNTRLTISTVGNIGIGTTSPSAKLDVVGTTELNGTVDISGEVNMTAMDVSFYAYNFSDDNMPFLSFIKVEFNSERHDDGSNYNTTLDQFVAPATGVYHFDVGVQFESIVSGSSVTLKLYKNGVEFVLLFIGDANDGSVQIYGGSAVIKLNAGDYIEVFARSGDFFPIISGSNSGVLTYFSGHRLY